MNSRDNPSLCADAWVKDAPAGLRQGQDFDNGARVNRSHEDAYASYPGITSLQAPVE